jgi:hypothetical protein
MAHLACPKLAYTGGKSAVNLPYQCGAVADIVAKITKRWRQQREREIRPRYAVLRRREALAQQQRAEQITIKDAAAAVMRQAYLKASGGYPAKARGHVCG